MCLNCPPLKNAEMIHDAIRKRLPKEVLLDVTYDSELEAYIIWGEKARYAAVSLEDDSEEIKAVINMFVDDMWSWHKECKSEISNTNWDLELKKLVEEETF